MCDMLCRCAGDMFLLCGRKHNSDLSICDNLHKVEVTLGGHQKTLTEIACPAQSRGFMIRTPV